MPWHLADIWEAYARQIPDSPALIHGDRVVSWSEFDDRADRLAAWLAAQGFGAEAKVAILSRNRIEFMEVYFAAIKIGSTPFGVNYYYRERELSEVLDYSEAEILFSERELLDVALNLAPDLAKLRRIVAIDGKAAPGVEDYSTLMHGSRLAAPVRRTGEEIRMVLTGGTTGKPKGVLFRMRDVARSYMKGWVRLGRPEPATADEAVEAGVAAVRQGRPHINLNCCPQMHGHGIATGTCMALAMGGTVITVDRRRFDPARVWELIEARRATQLVFAGDAFAVPLANALDASPDRDLRSLKSINSTGAHWSRWTKEVFLRHLDVVLWDGLAATEAGMGVMRSHRGELAMVEAFIPNPNVFLIDEDMRRIAPGSDRIGKIVVQTPSPFAYFRDPVKSAETFLTIDGKPHSAPGDFGRYRPDGMIAFLGRGGTVVNSGGEKVHVDEVERVIREIDGVHNSAVVGAPDPVFGEVVAAVVELRQGANVTPETVIQHVRTQLAGFKVPRHVLFLDAVPVQVNGKTDYRSTRALVHRILGEADEQTAPAAGDEGQ